jgi:rhomboid family GlyGly-CTERM serine protease
MKTAIAIEKPETWVFALILMAANLTLFAGSVCNLFIYSPAQVGAGEWWRVLSFPFVHVSWYHLLMDAGAFLFLYHGLQTTALWKRLAYVCGCALGSLLVSLQAESLCGLSGIAHGLMVIAGLEMMETDDSGSRTIGKILFWSVLLKSLYEALSGHVAFSFLHFGNIGNAVAVCHAGGVLGGICTYALTRRIKLRRT